MDTQTEHEWSGDGGCPGSQRVLPDRYEPLMSSYLRDGRRGEVWHINWIEWDGQALRASARLDGSAGSGTDGGRFHLSIFSAREMEAQLGIIGLHLKLGLSRKTAEVWHLKGTEKCLKAITDSHDVGFEIHYRLRRSSSGKLLNQQCSRISDAQGGDIRVKALKLMPWNEAWGPLLLDGGVLC
jgi:hypothetical protein